MTYKATQLALLLVLCGNLGTTIAETSLNTDLTLVSDRLLRGFSLSNEEPSLYGGVHYQHGSGFYAHGVLFSNIQIFGISELQLDAVAGYKFNLEPIVLDIGYVGHMFSRSDDVDSGEWYIGGIYQQYSFHYYTDPEAKEDYADFNVHFSICKRCDLALHAGNLRASKLRAKSFTDASIGLTKEYGKKFKLGLTYAYNDNDGVLDSVAGSHFVLSASKAW